MMAKKFKKGTYLSFEGYEEILKKLDDMGKINEAMEKGIKQASIPIERDLLSYMNQHRITDATIGAFHKGTAKWKGNDLSYGFGWLTNDAGLPALFLDLGTPTMEPSYFTYHARTKNMDTFNTILMSHLEKFLTGVWG